MKTRPTTTVDSINRYIQNMQGIEPKQHAALEYIFNFIEHLDISTDPVNDRSSPNNKPTEMTPEDAAIRLQRAIRNKQIADISALQVNNFFSINNRPAYLSMLSQQDIDSANHEITNLAKIMYGKTIAGISPTKCDDFPAEQYAGWSFRKYHRDDQVKGELYNNIIHHYEANQNEDELYIPFINVKNTSINDLINNYLNIDERKLIKQIYNENGARIGMMSLCSVNNKKQILEKLRLVGLISPELEDINSNCSDDETIYVTKISNTSAEDLIKNYLTDEERKLVKEVQSFTKHIVISLHDSEKQKRNDIVSKIRSAGLLPSPWEIAQFNTKLDNSNITSNEPNNILIDKSNLTKLPNSVSTLKNSELMMGLLKIVASNSPCKLLAACLHRMISALPDNVIHHEIIQRLSLFLSFGVTHYHNNYERFAFIVYAATHEISLFIKHALNHDIKITDYNQFKATIEKRSISSFGLLNDNRINCKSIAAPAMSGTHAFLVALHFAKQVTKKQDHELTIQAVDPLYFEFDKYAPLQKHNDNNGLADIYHITVGPVISNEKGLIPGTDINKFIRNKILKHSIDKHVSILVDVTSALYKNLKLDEEVKQLVAQGKISIICNESYQKFGLVHTDQVQAGVVYGLYSMTSFMPTVINQFEENAKHDFDNHLDMIVAQFIRQHCYDYLQRIKEQHFKNGSLFRKFFESKSIYLDPDHYINSVHQYDEMLTNLDELYFLVINPGQIKNWDEYRLHFAPQDCITSRDSFGHFATTYMFIQSTASYGTYSRVSPNASDNLDVTISMITILLFGKFKKDELYNLLNSILLSRKSIDTPFSREEEIFFASLLVGLTRFLIKSGSSSDKNQLLLLLRGINHLIYNASNNLIGRNSYHLLKDTFTNRGTIFSPYEIDKFVDETIKTPLELNKANLATNKF